MSKVHVCRQHGLDQARCRVAAVELLDRLVSRFGGSYNANGDQYRYQHSMGVTAIVEARHHELDINVKLGLMARAFAPQLEQQLHGALDDYFASI